jgi:hypothetical protein
MLKRNTGSHLPSQIPTEVCRVWTRRPRSTLFTHRVSAKDPDCACPAAIGLALGQEPGWLANASLSRLCTAEMVGELAK